MVNESRTLQFFLVLFGSYGFVEGYLLLSDAMDEGHLAFESVLPILCGYQLFRIADFDPESESKSRLVTLMVRITFFLVAVVLCTGALSCLRFIPEFFNFIFSNFISEATFTFYWPWLLHFLLAWKSAFKMLKWL